MPIISIRRRPWFDPRWHLVVLTLLAIGLVLAMVLLHCLLKNQYRQNTEPLVNEAVLNYHVRVDDRTGVPELYQGDKAYGDLSEADRPGPLGLGRDPAFRGALIAARQEVRSWAQGVDARLRQAVAAEPTSSRDGAIRLGLNRITDPPTGSVDQYMILDGAAVARQVHDHPGLNFVAGWSSLVLAADVADPEGARQSASAVAVVGSTAVRAAMQRVQQAGDRVAASLPTLRTLRPAERSACQSWICKQLKSPEVPATVTTSGKLSLAADSAVGTPQSSVLSGAAGVDEHSPTIYLTQILFAFEKELQNRLMTTFGIQLGGSFWLFGPWQWWELAIWTWYGVLARGLYDTGAFVVGYRRREVFQPSEAWRIFARLAYAPMFTLVAFWLSTSSDLIAGPTFLADHTLAALGIAFLMGLFPNTLYRLFTDIVERVFKTGAAPTGDGDKPLVPGQVKIDRPGGPPTIDALKVRLQRVAVAPLLQATYPAVYDRTSQDTP